MRFNIKFRLEGNRQVLPLNYQYPISSWIYKVLAKGDAELAGFLHTEGYRLENQKTFKLFTFSQLRFPHKTFKIIKGTDRMELWSRNAWLTIVFQLPQPAEKFIMGLFRYQTMTIGDKISQLAMEVESVEVVKEPEIMDESVKIRCLSPIVVSENRPGEKHETYLSPLDDNYAGLFFHNLLDKHKIISNDHEGLDPFTGGGVLSFECLTKKPKGKMLTIKAFTPEEVKVRGYLYEFAITAPPDLISTGLNSGFGAMNAMGFGCGEVVERIEGIEWVT